jgi:hypothetical protein
MKHIILIAGAAAFAVCAPAYAKPGMGHGNPHAYGNSYGANGPVGYGVHGCPPGLAKKAVPCVPPGQAKKIYGIGERLPLGAFNPYAYNRIPYDLRTRYDLSPYGNYYYGNGYLYRVDPRTMLVQQVVSALLRR